MSNFRSSLRSGAEAVVAATEGSGNSGKFTPTHQFKIGEMKYLQFLEPVESLTTVLMHQFIIVGYRDNGTKIFERFISRRDKNIDGPEGYDLIWDKFGEPPTERTFTLAVEMKPLFGTPKGKTKVIDGFEVATRDYTNRDGDSVTVPNVALVIESPYTLFGHITTLADLGPIEETIFGIKQIDRRKNFTVLQTGQPAMNVDDELGEFLLDFDFDNWLLDLADADRMKELIEPLPDDWKITDYPAKDKGKDKEESSGSTRTRREPDEPDDEPEEEAGEERKNRFQDLQRKAKERAAAKA